VVTRSRVLGWLEDPRAPRRVLALGLALALPSLAIGLFCDDHEFIAALEHRLAFSMPWWDLYRFTPATADGVRAAVKWGEYPWWTAPELHLHFFRPLASALLSLDYAVFGRAALFWHLHSLAWYGALLAAAGALFRRVLSPATASLALLVFALSDANVMPFAWPSARHCVLAAFFSATGLVCHVRARRDGWRAGRWLAPASFVVGLTCGESALGGVAFAVAYDLAGPAPGTLRERATRSLAPAVPALVYLPLYAAAGFGARGSAGYLSPLSEPGAFFAAAVTRAPVLLCDAILGVPSELGNVTGARGLAIAGAIATVLFVLLWVAVAPAVPQDERATVRWLALGSLVAMAAGVGGFPGARELLVPNLGFAAIAAVTLRHGFGAGPLALVRRAGLGLLALMHVGLAPLLQVGNQLSMRVMGGATEVAALQIALHADLAGRIRVVAASDPMIGMFAPAVLASQNEAPLGCWAWLSGVRADMVVERTGRGSFALSPKGTTFLRGSFEALFRAPWLPLHVGDEQAVCGARVRVASLEGTLPSRIEITTDEDLDAPTGAWLAWQAGYLRNFAFPPVGESLTIPWTAGPSGVF
jgi:hypothetical protein